MKFFLRLICIMPCTELRITLSSLYFMYLRECCPRSQSKNVQIYRTLVLKYLYPFKNKIEQSHLDEIHMSQIKHSPFSHHSDKARSW